MTQSRDHVGRILDQWARERPDLDVSPMGIIGRLSRLERQVDAQLSPVFAEAGLGEGDFDVLATLRRSGEPYSLAPGELAASTMVTSGAVTKRVDRLERAGLVSRQACPKDGRGRRVTLTPRGFELVDSLVERHVENERRLVGMLSELERSRLAHLLETWGRRLDAAEE